MHLRVDLALLFRSRLHQGNKAMLFTQFLGNLRHIFQLMHKTACMANKTKIEIGYCHYISCCSSVAAFSFMLKSNPE